VTRNPEPQSKDEIRAALWPRRAEVLRRHAGWIREHEPFALRHAADGARLEPGRLAPYLVEVTEPADLALWRYFRFLGAMPAADYVGRRMRFLVRDASLPNHPIMGVAALGSCLMNMRVRDTWIGWTPAGRVTASERRRLKEAKRKRLITVADLYVSQAVPPYNDLIAGKLVCLLMTSNEVRDAYARKYAGRRTIIAGRASTDLALIVTTSIFGGRSSLYNRLRYRDQLAYIPVGETQGLGTVHVGDAEFAAMRAYLAARGVEPSHGFGAGNNWRMRIIRTYHDIRRREDPAHRTTGLSALHHGQRRGVYVAPLADNAREYLCSSTEALEPVDRAAPQVIDWWRQRWLAQRSKSTEVMARVAAFTPDALRLTPLLT
jgi:hypothetical protein